jgi:hypothetical protein
MYEENPAVVEAPKPSYEFLETEVARLTAQTEYLSNRNRDYANEFNRKRNALEEYLDENWDDLGMHANEIAEIFGIALTKEVDVTVTVEYEITLTIPRSCSTDDLNEYEFDFDNISYNGEGDMDNSIFNVTQFEATDRN